MKKIFSLMILMGLLATPFFTDAHVKWFTEVAPEKETIENILSPLFMSLTLLAAIILALLAIMIPRTTDWQLIRKWDAKLSSLRRYSRPIIKIWDGSSFDNPGNERNSFCSGISSSQYCSYYFGMGSHWLLVDPTSFSHKGRGGYIIRIICIYYR